MSALPLAASLAGCAPHPPPPDAPPIAGAADPVDTEPADAEGVPADAGAAPTAGTGWPGVFGVVGLRDARTAVVCWQDCRVVDLASGRTLVTDLVGVTRPSRVAVAADGSVGVLENDPHQLARLDPMLRERTERPLPDRADELVPVSDGWWVRMGDRVEAFRGSALTPAPSPLAGSVTRLLAAGDTVAALGPDGLTLLDGAGAVVATLELPGLPEHVALDPAGRVAVGTAAGTLHLRAPGATGWTRGPDGRGPFAWVPGTPWLARRGTDGVELVDPGTGEVVPTELSGSPVGATADGGVLLVSASFREGWGHVVPVPLDALREGWRPLGTTVGALAFAADGSALFAGTWHGLLATLDPATGAWRSGRRLGDPSTDREVRMLLPVGDAVWVGQPDRLTILRGADATAHRVPVRGGVAPGARDGEVVVGGGWLAATAVHTLDGGAPPRVLLAEWPAWKAQSGPDEEIFAPGHVYRPVTEPEPGVAGLDLATGTVSVARVGGRFSPAIAGGDGAVVAVTAEEVVTLRTPDLVEVGRCPLPGPLRLAALAVDRTGRQAAVADGAEILRVTLTGCTTRALSSPDPVASLAFSPDGATLAAGTEGGAVWLWR